MYNIRVIMSNANSAKTNSANTNSSKTSRFERLKASASGGLSSVTSFFKRKVDSIMNSQKKGEHVFIALIYFFIVLIVMFTGFYMYRISNYTNKHCGYIHDIYKEPASLASLDIEKYKDNKFRDFYIKSAYNCCAIGNFTQTFVDLCGLKNVLRQGARCLDFEIYAVDEQPVIAVSATNNYFVKQSFNFLTLNDVLNYIITYGFSGAVVPNYQDPLILHFRVKTKLIPIMNEMSKSITNILSERLLDSNYNDAYFNQNLGGVSISSLSKKIIIAVNVENSEVLKCNKLMKVTNMLSGTEFFRLLRKHDILYTPSSNELVDYNKQCMTIAIPDLTYSSENLPFHLCLEYGIQMISMCYQNFDANMEICAEFFDDNNSAFVLKPASLRYEPIVIEAPEPLPKSVSFAPRHVKKPYYSFKM